LISLLTQRTVSSTVALAFVLAGCGEEREQSPEEVALAFFHDVAEDNVEAGCDKLTGHGRAAAIGRSTVVGRLPKPATREQCIEDGLSIPRSSVDLPGAVNDLRVSSVEVAGKHATVVISFDGLRAPQRLRNTSNGWKIDEFVLPVHD
jgi:hypothetical protein